MPFRKSSWRGVFVHLITIGTFDQEIGLFDWVGNGVYICINSNMFQCKVIYSNSIWLPIVTFWRYLNTGEQFLQFYIQIHINDNDGCDSCSTFADIHRNKRLWWVTNTLYKCIQGVIVFSFMQFRTGIPRINQSKSYMLLLTKYACLGILKYCIDGIIFFKCPINNCHRNSMERVIRILYDGLHRVPQKNATILGRHITFVLLRVLFSYFF